MAKTKETKKENIVTVNTVESTQKTINKPVDTYKANLQKIIIADVLAMVSDMLTRFFNSIANKTQASINSYNKNMAVVSNLHNMLDVNADIHTVDYSRLATICRLLGIPSTMELCKVKRDKASNIKASEGIKFSCKADGTIILAVLGHKYIASTLIGQPCDVKTQAILVSDVETQDTATATLYKDIDTACSKFLKAKGVPTWDMTQKIDRYHNWLESNLRTYYKSYVDMVEAEKKNKLN